MITSYLPVYNRSDVTMVRGEGAYLFDDAGKRYLDFAAGIAVNALGHCHPEVTKALVEQANTLWHCSNMYKNPWLEKYSQQLVDASFADTAFFCSSGAEAVECGIKMIRKYFDTIGQPERYRLITMKNGFHGRTLVGISAGGNETARAGYGPLVDGFDAATFNDLASVEALIGSETAGILVEPVLGEGGVLTATMEFLKGLRALADKHGLVLFFDEVQCGMGRTGRLFASEYSGVTPDIITLAKGIGNGFPLAACLSIEKIAKCMTPGSHGSTYGSNPLAMVVGSTVLEVLQEKGFMERVRETGVLLKSELEKLQRAYPQVISEVRGLGLMVGLTMGVPNRDFSAKLREHGLLAAPAYNNVVRLVPPLIIDASHVNEAIGIIECVAKDWK